MAIRNRTIDANCVTFTFYRHWKMTMSTAPPPHPQQCGWTTDVVWYCHIYDINIVTGLIRICCLKCPNRVPPLWDICSWHQHQLVLLTSQLKENLYILSVYSFLVAWFPFLGHRHDIFLPPAPFTVFGQTLNAQLYWIYRMRIKTYCTILKEWWGHERTSVFIVNTKFSPATISFNHCEFHYDN